MEELQKQYDEEQQRLQESEKQNDEKFVELEKEWDTIKEDLTEFLKEETKKGLYLVFIKKFDSRLLNFKVVCLIMSNQFSTEG